MEKLYIIGNGFDLYHQLPTSYREFSKFLENNNVSVYDEISKSISYQISDNNLWHRFEENLSFIDMEYLVDEICEYIPSLSSDEYCSDMAACERVANTIVYNLTEGFRNEFSNFIRVASSFEIDPRLLLDVDLNAVYISFNYTKTLENHYGIKSNNILYIHGTFDDRESIVLGHAVDPDTFVQVQENISPPQNLTPEEYEQWEEEMSNQHVPFLDEAREELSSYYQRSFKNSEEIIENNSNFFASLGSVRNIFVLGHSMSDVDMKYFEAIKDRTPSDCHWSVSFYGDSEKAHLEDILSGLGIPPENFKLITLRELNINY